MKTHYIYEKSLKITADLIFIERTNQHGVECTVVVVVVRFMRFFLGLTLWCKHIVEMLMKDGIRVVAVALLVVRYIPITAHGADQSFYMEGISKQIKTGTILSKRIELLNNTLYPPSRATDNEKDLFRNASVSIESCDSYKQISDLGTIATAIVPRLHNSEKNRLENIRYSWNRILEDINDFSSKNKILLEQKIIRSEESNNLSKLKTALIDNSKGIYKSFAINKKCIRKFLDPFLSPKEIIELPGILYVFCEDNVLHYDDSPILKIDKKYITRDHYTTLVFITILSSMMNFLISQAYLGSSILSTIIHCDDSKAQKDDEKDDDSKILEHILRFLDELKTFLNSMVFLGDMIQYEKNLTDCIAYLSNLNQNLKDEEIDLQNLHGELDKKRNELQTYLKKRKDETESYYSFEKKLLSEQKTLFQENKIIKLNLVKKLIEIAVIEEKIDKFSPKSKNETDEKIRPQDVLDLLQETLTSTREKLFEDFSNIKKEQDFSNIKKEQDFSNIKKEQNSHDMQGFQDFHDIQGFHKTIKQSETMLQLKKSNVNRENFKAQMFDNFLQLYIFMPNLLKIIYNAICLDFEKKIETEEIETSSRIEKFCWLPPKSKEKSTNRKSDKKIVEEIEELQSEALETLRKIVENGKNQRTNLNSSFQPSLTAEQRFTLYIEMNELTHKMRQDAQQCHDDYLASLRLKYFKNPLLNEWKDQWNNPLVESWKEERLLQEEKRLQEEQQLREEQLQKESNTNVDKNNPAMIIVGSIISLAACYSVIHFLGVYNFLNLAYQNLLHIYTLTKLISCTRS